MINLDNNFIYYLHLGYIVNDSNVGILKLLFSTFSVDNLPLKKNSIIRNWSLDYQWFNPSDSGLLLSHLIKHKWIVINENNLLPNPNLILVRPKLGWKPSYNELMNISNFNVDNKIVIQEININNKKTELSEPDIVQESNKDDVINKLINYVALNSGLSKREVRRRAERKRLALGPITVWMCIALLAREQGIDVNYIIQIIENS